MYRSMTVAGSTEHALVEDAARISASDDWQPGSSE